MKTKNTVSPTPASVLILFTTVLLTACGVNQVETDPQVTEGLTAASTSYTSSASSSSSSGGTVTTSTSGVSPVQMRIGTIGYNAVSVSVATTSILKVEWQPGVQDTAISGTNYEPEYSMLGVYITVGSSTQATEMVTNGYGGTVAQTTPVMDFSADIPSGSNGNVTIVVSQPNYDYYCLNYEMYCSPVPWMHVLATHPWHGTLLVQTDSTAALE